MAIMGLLSSLSSPTAATSMFSAAASMTTTYCILKSTSDQLVPEFLRNHLSSFSRRLSKRLSFQLTVVIEEFDDADSYNHRFEAATYYLSMKVDSPLTQRIKVSQPVEEVERDVIRADIGEEIVDSFNGVKLNWVLRSEKGEKGKDETRFFYELKFNRKHKDTVLKDYLPYIAKMSNKIKEETKVLKLFPGTSRVYVPLTHPASFKTIAMEPEKKAELIKDLDGFQSRKDYYRSVGKAWKRGYLLYGPPGTGKSSLIAAMADYLKFDIFDLDLKSVQGDSDLRRLFLRIPSSKCMIVIEDIDCSGVNVGKRDPNVVEVFSQYKTTLSGLLNAIDGLWSSCVDERIIVFTTNHKEKLDPALLRPGRMDVHIEMSYCTFGSFKILARNYLNIEDHRLFGDIQRLLSEVEVSPADVAGQLMTVSNDVDTTFEVLVKFLSSKKKKIPESKPAKPSQESETPEPEKQQPENPSEEAEKQEPAKPSEEAEKHEESSKTSSEPTILTLRNKMLQLVKRLRRNKKNMK